MSYEERVEITREMERLFYSLRGVEPEVFCEERCSHFDLCEQSQMYYGCGVWEEGMGEDL